jgi:hypothetical protein
MASQISTSGLEDLRSLLDVFDYVMPDVVPATAAETPAEMNMTPNSKRLKMSYPVNSSQHSNSSIGQHFSSLMEDNFFASIYTY